MSTSETKSSLGVAVTLVVIALAVGFLVYRQLPGSGGLRMDLVSVMSRQLASELDALHEGPARIVCVSRANSPSVFASEKAVHTFRAAAEKHGHRVVAEEYASLSEMYSGDEGVLLTVPYLVGLMGRHSDATVVVSLVGIPHIEEGEADQLAGLSAPLVAVAYEEDALDSLLASGALDLAVIFHESTPLDNPDVTPAELEQFISFRHAGG